MHSKFFIENLKGSRTCGGSLRSSVRCGAKIEGGVTAKVVSFVDDTTARVARRDVHNDPSSSSSWKKTEYDVRETGLFAQKITGISHQELHTNRYSAGELKDILGAHSQCILVVDGDMESSKTTAVSMGQSLRKIVGPQNVILVSSATAGGGGLSEDCVDGLKVSTLSLPAVIQTALKETDSIIERLTLVAAEPLDPENVTNKATEEQPIVELDARDVEKHQPLVLFVGGREESVMKTLSENRKFLELSWTGIVGSTISTAKIETETGLKLFTANVTGEDPNDELELRSESSTDKKTDNSIGTADFKMVSPVCEPFAASEVEALYVLEVKGRMKAAVFGGYTNVDIITDMELERTSTKDTLADRAFPWLMFSLLGMFIGIPLLRGARSAADVCLLTDAITEEKLTKFPDEKVSDDTLLKPNAGVSKKS